MKNYLLLFSLLLSASWSSTLLAAVILQYHHVSEHTPSSTSISPQQFAKHLQYLADNNFTVVPLSTLISQSQQQQDLNAKIVAITFDDAYQDIMSEAKPLLDKFGYPYTIFVNPDIINKQGQAYLSWRQLNQLASEGVIIANHGWSHTSIARKPAEQTEASWLAEYGQLLLQAEQKIAEHTGKSWRYFAYPYGEYTKKAQQWLTKHNFTAFTQQSGAVGKNTDLNAIPRFPVSQPYDQLSGLGDKLNALPLAIKVSDPAEKNIYVFQASKTISFTLTNNDFQQSQLNCYISGLGRQSIQWHNNYNFSITYSGDLPVGRVRCNCTAPSIKYPGRYYWYSKPWFILPKDQQWYPL